ncbi:hypothetical protein FDP41_006433 [Naegleria fowleri]|uniref:BTB domain-containing protein n=1 Tax=Naegleria fowleri TaxID=5763 RepID=A0A6A5BIZ7_NAEFO|nr:uncharacterized protein FDP41_006433 [Naegleria fowleri]KAF0974401.1 hypothetical protein FDP41_006433 [Naegleria fowleri]
MSDYLKALYGEEEEYDDYDSNEEDYDEDPYLEKEDDDNQEEVVENVDPQQDSNESEEVHHSHSIPSELGSNMTSWSSCLLFPPKPSFKNHVRSLSKQKKVEHHERVIEYIGEEEVEKYKEKYFNNHDLERWNSTYQNTIMEKTSMITKVPIRFIESHKLIYEKVDHVLGRKPMKPRGAVQDKVVDLGYDLALSNMVGCLFSNYIYLSGGEKDGNSYSQTIVFDIHNKKWINFSEIYNNCFGYWNRQWPINPPHSKDHILVSLSGYLIWSSWNECLYLQPPAQLIEGNIFFSKQWDSVSMQTLDTIEHTTNYSHSSSQNKFWIFGRRSLKSKQVTNQLVVGELTRATSYSITLVRKLVPSDGAPLPRENHAQCQVDDKIFIYGGNYMETHQLLNDLHVFNATAKQWIEVDLSISPPPMRNHSLCSVGKYIYLSGGILENNKISNVMYRYNVSKGRFSVVIPNNQDALVCAAGRAFHYSIAIYDHILFVGGLCDLQQRKHAPHAALLHYALDDGVENSAYVYLKHQLEKQKQGDLENYDMILRVADRDHGESHYLYCHRTLLMTRSEYFKNLLQQMSSQEVEYSEDGTKIVMNMEHKYHLDAVQVYVRFLYTGNVILPEDVQESCLQEIIELSKFDHPKHQIFSDLSERKKIYLDSSAKILQELKSDFHQLYLQVEQSVDNFICEPCFENSYADVTIQILDPHSHQVLHQLRAHKFFLNRSAYFDAVFSSKMEESTTGIIKFNEISLNGLLCVLKYLYTNQIVVSIETAIEVFLSALLFQLNEVANHARVIVRNNITAQNALELVVLADVYNDVSIRNHCIKVIAENFTELSSREAYQYLPEKVKSETREVYLYKLRKLSKQKKFNNSKE